MYVLFRYIQGASLWPWFSTGRGPKGAWQKFERGEIDLFSFYEAFSRDLSDTVNGNIWLVVCNFFRGLNISFAGIKHTVVVKDSVSPY